MNELREIIRRAPSVKKELVASTIRLAAEDQSFVEEFAAQYLLTQQEALRSLLRAGIRQALMEIESLKDSEPFERKSEEANAVNKARFFILNTNKSNSVESHRMMLTEGVAAAFYDPWKFKIDRIQKEDVVFLYENGKGIVAYGMGTGQTLKAEHEGFIDECHYQFLSDFKILENELSASEVKAILARNVVFLQTMSGAPDGQKILDRIKATESE